MNKFVIDKYSIENESPKINCIYIECGEFSYRIERVSISYHAMKHYKKIGESLNWVNSDKFRIFIFVMMLEKGLSLNETLNVIMSKKYIQDEEYQKMYRQLFLGDWKETHTMRSWE